MSNRKNKHILKVNYRGTKKQFLFDDDEWEDFLMRYEENELIPKSEFNAYAAAIRSGNIKLTQIKNY